MFHDIPEPMTARMRELEAIDLRERDDGTPLLKRLRQIPSEVGKFIAILAASAPDGQLIEIGTSAGYSTMWLSLACRETGRKLTTFEILAEKAARARQTFKAAGIENLIEFIHGDALAHLPGCKEIAFCFLDAEKDVYGRCFEEVAPRMVRGGLLVADNAISHESELRPMLDSALRDPRFDSLVVPIGSGVLVSRRR